MITIGALLFSPTPGGADEEPAEKSAAVAKAPDFTGDLVPAPDPAPDVWTQTGEAGDWAQPAREAATSAMLTWGRLMELPFDVQTRVAAIANPQLVAARHTELAARFNLNRGFAARLESALASVATDAEYEAYSEYNLADLTVTYSSSDESCLSPCITTSGFVVFTARPQYRLQDGNWKTVGLTQFQVTLDPLNELDYPNSPDDWRVDKFYAIPLEGEGSAAGSGV